MKGLILLLFIVFGTGCVCLNPDHRRPIAPTVETGKVIEELKDTKEELVKAGESNTAVGKSVDKALTLAERLDAILEEIERSQNKNVIKPE
jgi:hypothetical protein